jgi:hypothetical protein
VSRSVPNHFGASRSTEYEYVHTLVVRELRTWGSRGLVGGVGARMHPGLAMLVLVR